MFYLKSSAVYLWFTNIPPQSSVLSLKLLWHLLCFCQVSRPQRAVQPKPTTQSSDELTRCFAARKKRLHIWVVSRTFQFCPAGGAAALLSAWPQPQCGGLVDWWIGGPCAALPLHRVALTNSPWAATTTSDKIWKRHFFQKQTNSSQSLEHSDLFPSMLFWNDLLNQGLLWCLARPHLLHESSSSWRWTSCGTKSAPCRRASTWVMAVSGLNLRDVLSSASARGQRPITWLLLVPVLRNTVSSSAGSFTFHFNKSSWKTNTCCYVLHRGSLWTNEAS